ncbi:uncharacterized protein LOC134836118 [Culicoides brevitarsis]|uniref:uncharacterized protein LOC134836118 n=1 Tax=Culicoides brevitarsis TaxID=469753 RepID=UPI00307C05A7
MTQFVRKTFVAHFFVLSSLIALLTTATKLKSHHYSVWRYEEQRHNERPNVTFDVKIAVLAARQPPENQYNLLVKFANVLWRTNGSNNVNYPSSPSSLYGLKLGAEGQCMKIYAAADTDTNFARTVAYLLLPESRYRLSEMRKNVDSNALSDCFEVTPLGHCKVYVKSSENGSILTKHTVADYCDEEEPVYESLLEHAKRNICPDSSLDAKYFIDQTDNELSRVEISFKINYPFARVLNSYALTFKGYEEIDRKDDVSDLTIPHDCIVV